MSLQEKLNNLLIGIKDPEQRINVASTINYILDVFSTGNANEDDIRNDLYEICRDIFSVTMAGSNVNEITKKAKDTAEDLLRTFKLTSLTRRAMSKYKIPLP